MRTTTVSQILIEERQQRRISVEEMAKLTRIRLEYLQALEEGKFELLPPAVFVKGYIKSYSRLLGLDAEPLIALLRRDFKESAQGKLVPREFINPVLRQKFGWQPITLIGMLLSIFFITVLSYVGFQWYKLQLPPELIIAAPLEQAAVGPVVVVSGKTESDAIVSVNTMPVALQVDGSFQTEVTFLTEGISTITVEAADKRGKVSLKQVSVYVQF